VGDKRIPPWEWKRKWWMMCWIKKHKYLLPRTEEGVSSKRVSQALYWGHFG